MIERINKDFVALEVNITNSGFPKELPALKPWEKAFNADWHLASAYAVCVVCSPDGQLALGTSGKGCLAESGWDIKFRPSVYLKFLSDASERRRRAAEINNDAKLNEAERAQKLKALLADVGE